MKLRLHRAQDDFNEHEWQPKWFIVKKRTLQAPCRFNRALLQCLQTQDRQLQFVASPRCHFQSFHLYQSSVVQVPRFLVCRGRIRWWGKSSDLVRICNGTGASACIRLVAWSFYNPDFAIRNVANQLYEDIKALFETLKQAGTDGWGRDSHDVRRIMEKFLKCEEAYYFILNRL